MGTTEADHTARSPAATSHRVSGGPPRFFALAATRSGTLLAGTCGRGTSRSTDGGRTWTPVEGPGNGVVHDFAVAPDGNLLATTGTGLHRSTDDGRTWHPLALRAEVLYGVHVADEVLVGTAGGGVARSSDGGATWSADRGLEGTSVYRVLAVAGAGELAATEDRGIWVRRSGPWRPTGVVERSVYALVDLGQGAVLAGTRGAGILRSDDGGESWSPVTPGPPDPVIHILVTRDDGSVLAGTGHGVHVSRDRGDTWDSLGEELANRRIFSLVDGPTVLAGSYDGVWAWSGSEAGWEPVDTGLSPDEAFTVAVGPAPAHTALAGTKAGALASDDRGQSWHEVSGLAGATAHTFCWTSDGDVLAGTADGLWRATDPGQLATGPWVREGLSGRWVFSLLEVDDGRLLAGTLGHGTFARVGPGQWEESGVGPRHPATYDLCRTRDGTLLAATGYPVDGGKSGAILRSTDGGQTWRPASHEPITVYRVVEDRSGTLFAGAQRCHLLTSADGGRSWRPIPPPVGDLKMYCLAIDPGDRLYLGAGALLLRSDDGARSWQEVGEGLDGVTTYDLANVPDGLLAATSAGVYRSGDHGVTWAPVGPGR